MKFFSAGHVSHLLTIRATTTKFRYFFSVKFTFLIIFLVGDRLPTQAGLKKLSFTPSSVALMSSCHPIRAPNRFFIHLARRTYRISHLDGSCPSIKAVGFSFRIVLAHLTSALTLWAWFVSIQIYFPNINGLDFHFNWFLAQLFKFKVAYRHFSPCLP